VLGSTSMYRDELEAARHRIRDLEAALERATRPAATLAEEWERELRAQRREVESGSVTMRREHRLVAAVVALSLIGVGVAAVAVSRGERASVPIVLLTMLAVIVGSLGTGVLLDEWLTKRRAKAGRLAEIDRKLEDLARTAELVGRGASPGEHVAPGCDVRVEDDPADEDDRRDETIARRATDARPSRV
jgi:hypothetical protein